MNDIEEVKSRLDIVEAVGSYVPSLKRAGSSYKGLCPFHQEKTPSFIVTPSMQIYKCFGCGEGGDVINFIQKMERVEFGEALQIAADRAGYKLTGSARKKDEKLELQKQRIYSANELAAKYWNYILSTHKAGKSGRDYLRKRKVRPEELKKFQLGYAPRGTNLLPYLVKKGYTPEELLSWGFAVDRNGEKIDKFRDRFILPIWDMKGRIVGFSGRIVTPSDYAPKYLNSPETLVYKKSDILMGLYQAITAARKQRFLILEEGNIDLLSSHKVGIENIAATGGTALTEQQVKLIKRYADTVYFAFDTDAAGTKALIRGLELAERDGLAHKSLELGSYQDPDAMISENPDLWTQTVNSPENTVAHLLKVLRQDLDLGNADDKSTFLQRMMPVLSALRDEVQVQHYAAETAVLVGISKQSVLDRLKGKPQKTPRTSSRETEAVADPEPIGQPNPVAAKEIYLLALLLQVQNLPDMEISSDIFRDVDCREIFTKLRKIGDATTGFDQLAVELSDGAKEVLQQVLATDITGVNNSTSEFERTYRIVYANFLRQKILELRAKLNETDDAQALIDLQYYIKELKGVGA